MFTHFLAVFHAVPLIIFACCILAVTLMPRLTNNSLSGADLSIYNSAIKLICHLQFALGSIKCHVSSFPSAVPSVLSFVSSFVGTGSVLSTVVSSASSSLSSPPFASASLVRNYAIPLTAMTCYLVRSCWNVFVVAWLFGEFPVKSAFVLVFFFQSDILVNLSPVLGPGSCGGDHFHPQRTT